MIFHYIYLSVGGHLGSFYFLDIINNVTMNVVYRFGVCVDIPLNCLAHTPKSEIAGSYSNPMFNTVKLFQSGCTFLNSHQKCMRVPISLHSHQDSLLSVFILAILVHVKWYLTVVSFCISPVANDVGPLFMCSLTILYLFWRDVYSNSFFFF